jgi:hypothetical protein
MRLKRNEPRRGGQLESSSLEDGEEELMGLAMKVVEMKWKGIRRVIDVRLCLG